MSTPRYPRASDLPAILARRSRAEARSRADRLRDRVVFIVQCGLGATLAWWIANDVLHHSQPFFAPVTAIVTLGMSYGQRVRRAAEVMIGVAVGILIGDAFAQVFGSGLVQIFVVVTLSMGVASFLDAGRLLTIQAGVQSAIITTLAPAPGAAFTRWLDAVIGGTVALIISVLAPTTALRRPGQRAGFAVQEIESILIETAAALRAKDVPRCTRALERARASESMLDELQELSDEGIAVVRFSPLRRSRRAGVQAIADLLEPLDRTVRNLRVLVRRSLIAVTNQELVPAAYIDLLDQLAASCADIARALHEGREPVSARPHLIELAERSTAVTHAQAGLSSEVMRAQVRSMVVDLLMLTGMPYAQARAQVPPPDKSSPATPA